MDRKLLALLKRGKIKNKQEAELFYKYRDDVEIDRDGPEPVSDIRIYLSEDKRFFCEIYGNENRMYDEITFSPWAVAQDIRFFESGERCFESYNEILDYLLGDAQLIGEKNISVREMIEFTEFLGETAENWFSGTSENEDIRVLLNSDSKEKQFEGMSWGNYIQNFFSNTIVVSHETFGNVSVKFFPKPDEDM